MLSRRELLKQGARAGATLALAPAGCSGPHLGTWVNDVHSRLNRTQVARVERPQSVEALRDALKRARGERRAVSVAAGRHAMGGQQFGSDTVLIDTTRLDRLVAFDPEEGTVTVEAGIGWPKLIPEVIALQEGAPLQWGIRQKQTGADRLSLGAGLSCGILAACP